VAGHREFHEKGDKSDGMYFSNMLNKWNLRDTGKWMIYGMVIGAITGTGAILFHLLLNWVQHFCLNTLAGFSLPLAGGEGETFHQSGVEIKKWLLLLLPAAGGLLAGLIVFKWAPEAEGHGTDAMIDSFHRLKGRIRGRVPFLKAISSVLTIGTGGSAGREGPVAQIGAGVGSFLARRLKRNSHERRIMLLAGAAGGIGSIFKSPLGGAIFVVEVLYKDDFESEALIPAIISSIVSYSIFSSYAGWDPLFTTPDFVFDNPLTLFFYAILGLACALLGAVYIKTFYGFRDHFFRKIPIPPHFKPAIGGLMIGFLALYFPQVLGGGYGWIQMALNGEMVIGLMLVLCFVKILGTSFTISSGGSGGVFAPSLFVGAMLGGVFGQAFHGYFPEIITQPSSFVLVGMGAFFAGAANVPISALIMVCEMARNYHLLAPMMLVSAIAYLFTKKWSIYEKQVLNKTESPAHLGDLTVNVMEEIKVSDIFADERDVVIISDYLPLREIIPLIIDKTDSYFPVSDVNGRLVGILSLKNIRKVIFEDTVKDLLVAGDLMTDFEAVRLEENLYTALSKFLEGNYGQIPVISEKEPDRVLGMLSHEDLINAYNRTIMARKFEKED
jgi:CIC family chloride channel protein